MSSGMTPWPAPTCIMYSPHFVAKSGKFRPLNVGMTRFWLSAAPIGPMISGETVGGAFRPTGAAETPAIPLEYPSALPPATIGTG